MREVERLVEAIQRIWLLRKYVNPTNLPFLRPLPGSGKPEMQSVKTLQVPRNAAK